MDSGQRDRLLPWAVVFGASAGAAAAAFAVLRFVRQRRRHTIRGGIDAIEEAAVDVLRHDRMTARCAIDVAALGPGIIELSGTVPTSEIGHRAARLLHALEGVRTVVNRLQAGSLEQHLAENRMRRASGAPQLRERRWFGGSVGMGRRRQSADTDPDRHDDPAELRADELDITAADIADATSADDAARGGDALQP